MAVSQSGRRRAKRRRARQAQQQRDDTIEGKGMVCLTLTTITDAPTKPLLHHEKKLVRWVGQTSDEQTSTGRLDLSHESGTLSVTLNLNRTIQPH